MKDMEQLENQLSSWVPRRPSAKLERRLFARHEGTETGQEQALGLRWLAPAMVAFVMLCILFNQRQGGIAASGANSGHLLAIISSNQSAYLPPSVLRPQNRPSENTFEWTNGSSFTSSVRSLLGPKAQ
jgi:hypothetical protein